MSVAVTGTLKGNIINLDDAPPELEGQRVRVILEPVTNDEVKLSHADQRRLWQAWVNDGPQGPINGEGEPDLP